MILVDKETGQEYQVLKGELIEITKTEPVDMQVLVNSGLDCEFKDLDNDSWVVGELTATQEKGDNNKRTLYWKSYDGTGAWFYKCRPRLNHFMSLKNCSEGIHERLVKAGFSAYKDGDLILIEGIHRSRYYPWEKESE